jgi:hypothetical protein
LIQRNAITSWTRLQPAPEILLFGEETGTSELAQELRIRHLPKVARNEFGTPFINDIFRQAEASATNPILAYVNADIVLLSSFLQAVQLVSQINSSFLMVGRRWNVEMRDPIDFQDGWEDRIGSYVRANGELEPHTGMDYFVFPKGMFDEMPAFAVGRPAWDNWFIFHTLRHKRPVIDATSVAWVIHQNHDYSHVPQGSGKRWEGPEADRNVELAGGFEHFFTIKDANFILTSKGIERPAWTKQRIFRHLYTRAILSHQPGFWLRLLKILFAHRNIEDYSARWKRYFS